MKTQKIISLISAGLIIASFVVAFPVFAQPNTGVGKNIMPGRQDQGSMVTGIVSAISGNTITITSRQMPAAKASSTANTAKTFIVDAAPGGHPAKIIKNNVAGTIASIAVGDTITVQGTISGTNIAATTIRDGAVLPGIRAGMGISGKVASINGTTITVTGKSRANGAAVTTTYTVNASSATIIKNGATATVSAISVGDTIIVQGTISGTNVAAKTIRDGNALTPVQGNGQPVVAGKITAISGAMITISNISDVTYTIDATNAKFVVKDVTTPTISNVAVGDNVIAQGTVNGNSVTASTIIDQKVAANSNTEKSKPKMGIVGGMVNGIGNFFKHLFGF